MNSRLIDRIAATANCDYISEVTYLENRLRVFLAAQELLKEGFDLEEWEYAVFYVTGIRHCFASQEELASFLRRETSNQKP